MARSVPIWKIYEFPKVSLYLERFVLKHATAHIHKRCSTFKKINLYLCRVNETEYLFGVFSFQYLK
jgi:hypothetical protein